MTIPTQPTTEAEADLILADLAARIAAVEDVRERGAELCRMRARLSQIELLAQEAEELLPPQNVTGERHARCYGLPRNPYLRFIEFTDGSHGVLRVKLGHPCRQGWEVDVIDGEAPGVYNLAGQYNRFGVRCA